mmetsp:Transcript_96004/g.175735  ORF Transcript_96004/g.175735 Transcript_96004/m.175735 type:complete len:91 (+) Transcript_96004:218-490(+)
MILLKEVPVSTEAFLPPLGAQSVQLTEPTAMQLSQLVEKSCEFTIASIQHVVSIHDSTSRVCGFLKLIFQHLMHNQISTVHFRIELLASS